MVITSVVGRMRHISLKGISQGMSGNLPFELDLPLGYRGVMFRPLEVCISKAIYSLLEHSSCRGLSRKY